MHKDCRKGFDNMIVMVWWSVRRKRNDKVFNGVSRQSVQLSTTIKESARLWVTSGYNVIADFVS
jgi:hypothetical protein